MLSIITRALLFYFDFWGFCTESSPSTIRRSFSFIIFLILQCSLLGLLTSSIYKSIVYNTYLSEAYEANEALTPYTLFITHLMIITESFISRKSQREFWTVFEQIRNLQNSPKIQLRSFSFWCILSICWECLTEAPFLYKYSNFLGSLDCLVRVLTFIIQNQVYQNRVYHYSLHVEIVNAHLEHVIQSLDAASVEKSTYQTINNENEDFQRKTRQNYLLIAESVEYINRIFGWSNVATILVAYNVLVSTFNWSIFLMTMASVEMVISKLKMLLDESVWFVK